MGRNLKINEVAHLLCTTPDAIRLYERKGIIRPARDENNQYRWFTKDDITRLHDCKLLQNVGFSLSEISDIISTASEEELEKMLEKKAAHVEEKLLRYTRMLDQIHRLQRAKYLMEYYVGRYFIRDSPHVLMCSYATEDGLDYRMLDCPFYQYVTEHHNMFRRCVIIRQENALSDESGMYGLPGYSIEVAKARELELGLEADELITELTPKSSVYTVITVEDKPTRAALQPTYDWLDSHSFQLKGDILAWTSSPST